MESEGKMRGEIVAKNGVNEGNCDVNGREKV